MRDWIHETAKDFCLCQRCGRGLSGDCTRDLNEMLIIAVLTKAAEVAEKDGPTGIHRLMNVNLSMFSK
jgi:hypothetical protein